MPPVAIAVALLPGIIQVGQQLADLIQQHHSGTEVTNEQLASLQKAHDDLNAQWAELAPKA